MKITSLLIPVCMAGLIACKNNNTSSDHHHEGHGADGTHAADTQKVTITPLTNSPSFENAGLTQLSPAPVASLKPGDSISFRYKLTNYELGKQTPDAVGKCCANSAQGQHIHLILNNEPYEAWYQEEFKKKLPEGHYVALSFISRSYHESIKNEKAYNLTQFSVGKPQPAIDLKAPHIFYSRPKGEYNGAECREILLDFFLVNTTLSPDGNKVIVTVNGKDKFTVDSWTAYVLKGLPDGENTVKLELVDKEGKLIDTPFNGVERKFTLKK